MYDVYAITIIIIIYSYLIIFIVKTLVIFIDYHWIVKSEDSLLNINSFDSYYTILTH